MVGSAPQVWRLEQQRHNPGGEMQVDRAQVLAFRWARQHLQRRLTAADGLTGTAPAAHGGLTNTPPGSVTLALHARLADLGPGDAERALEEDRTLLQTWSLRGAPQVFPTRDAAVFTLGLQPTDEPELRHFIFGVQQALDPVGMTATELAELAGTAAREALDGRTITRKSELDTAIADRAAARLPADRLDAWNGPSPFADRQTLGEGLISFALRPLALAGVLCLGERRGTHPTYVRTEQWLGHPIPAADRAHAQAELVRRYLRWYGPASPAQFAAWSGASPAFADRAWQHVATELTRVDFSGHDAWILTADSSELQAPPAPTGVRLLPPLDAWVQARDHATLMPDTTRHRQVWRTTGIPGTVVDRGELIGVWRPRTTSSRLRIRVEPFDPLAEGVRPQIEAEAAALATLRGRAAAEVTIS